MSISIADVALGMDVYSSDNQRFGVINELYNTTEAPDEGGEKGEHLWMQVLEGSTMNPLVEKLYFPFSSVKSVEKGQRITVDCAKADAAKRYGEKPDFL
ncbi:MAG: hypothetical protein ACRDFX_03965 [Chloroflexota bacterium]